MNARRSLLALFLVFACIAILYYKYTLSPSELSHYLYGSLLAPYILFVLLFLIWRSATYFMIGFVNAACSIPIAGFVNQASDFLIIDKLKLVSNFYMFLTTTTISLIAAFWILGNFQRRGTIEIAFHQAVISFLLLTFLMRLEVHPSVDIGSVWHLPLFACFMFFLFVLIVRALLGSARITRLDRPRNTEFQT